MSRDQGRGAPNFSGKMPTKGCENHPAAPSQPSKPQMMPEKNIPFPAPTRVSQAQPQVSLLARCSHPEGSAAPLSVPALGARSVPGIQDLGRRRQWRGPRQSLARLGTETSHHAASPEPVNLG